MCELSLSGNVVVGTFFVKRSIVVMRLVLNRKYAPISHWYQSQGQVNAKIGVVGMNETVHLLNALV